MDVSIRESLQRTLEGIDALELEAGRCRDIAQRVRLAAARAKKLYLADVLRLMLPMENELSEQDRAEFKVVYLELAGRVDLLAASLLSGGCIAADSFSMDVLERIAPCIRGSLQGVTYCRNSRMMRIAV